MMFDTESKLPTLSFGASMRLPLIIAKWSTVDATSVLKIGCGQGRLSSRLIRISSKYMAVEPDYESYLFAKNY
jgi:16S rRNA A1518/A1519 N6-dimethyltransferase RsmA/KsgA/DIM1 with predicted DNA glycosylase/AP lyase activity